MRGLLILGLSAGLSAACSLSVTTLAQTESTDAPAPSCSGAQVSFGYENPRLQPAKYNFAICENGSGHFHSEPAETPVLDTASYHPLAHALDRPVQLSAAVAGQFFSVARTQRFFAIPCEDTKSKVAFQGTKELSYRGPEGSGSCTYNWSKNNAIEKLTNIFESIAFTLEEGRRLEVEHKHDRLALDSELGTLIEAVKGGQATEVQTIEPVLKEIIADEAVLDRARSRARKLLDAGSATASLR